jgi:hypothetical protein
MVDGGGLARLSSRCLAGLLSLRLPAVVLVWLSHGVCLTRVLSAGSASGEDLHVE